MSNVVNVCWFSAPDTFTGPHVRPNPERRPPPPIPTISSAGNASCSEFTQPPAKRRRKGTT